MSFWQLNQADNYLAVIDEATGCTYSYDDFNQEVSIFKTHFKKQFNHKTKTLGFIFCRNNMATLTGYLATLQSQQAVCLLDANLSALMCDNLIATYQPEWIWWPAKLGILSKYTPVWQKSGYCLLVGEQAPTSAAINANLALLLTTSGTTGNPKMVRLSYRNLQANAVAIAQYLDLTPAERAVTTLPVQYSYGLSVINSHLLAGSTLLLTGSDLMNRKFWDFCREQKATSMAGVPYTYQMLHRLNFLKSIDLPSLRTITQAGGNLNLKLQQYFAEIARQKRLRFYIMYGQTEATARISYVPPSKIKQGLGTIGIAIPGGRLEIAGQTGELIYYGSNVMLGYAETRTDLTKGDELNGRLATGDLASLDLNGFFKITGRQKRFLKLYGLRLNLDDVEKLLEKHGHQHCFCIGNDAKLVVLVSGNDYAIPVKQLISKCYHIHVTAIKVIVLKDIPRSSSGKVDYKSLQERFGL